MPLGQTNYPDADYWGVTAGAQYLNDALARAAFAHSHDSTVAVAVIGSLQQIDGQSNMMAGTSGAPLIDAMGYPDRLVRFEAAFAIAGALPQKSFTGQERVVPLLAEALSQTGQMSVVVAASESGCGQRGLVDGLKKDAGMSAVGATSAESAVSAANALPAIDAIIISDDMPAAEVDKLMTLASTNRSFRARPKFVMVKSMAVAICRTCTTRSDAQRHAGSGRCWIEERDS